MGNLWPDTSDGRPHVSSELLEPHLVELLMVAVRELAIYTEAPDAAWFLTWARRFQGVSYLIIGMTTGGGADELRGPTHAGMAWGNMTHEWFRAAEDGYPFVSDGKFRDYDLTRCAESRSKLHAAARKAVGGSKPTAER